MSATTAPATGTSVATIIEVSASSHDSFEDAVASGIRHVEQDHHSVNSAWVKDHKVIVVDGEIQEYRVHLKVVLEAQ